MFFDRLFTLVSLKSRLLNSSFFSQIYSKERLPLRKFRVEGATLTPLIAGLLAACGGGGGGGPIPGGPYASLDPQPLAKAVMVVRRLIRAARHSMRSAAKFKRRSFTMT